MPKIMGFWTRWRNSQNKRPPMGTLRVPVTQHDHVLGSPDAPVTLVEYGDYECPFCGTAYPIVNQVLRHFGPKLRYVFRHFPLTKVHPDAERAAETAEFAGAHKHFWEMHDGLYENQDRLGPPLLFSLAETLGLSEVELRDALATEKYAPKVKSDFLGGVRSGVKGIPSFFINGRQYEGTFEFSDLVSAIDSHLSA
jgi:protein-disulfide isomerase